MPPLPVSQGPSLLCSQFRHRARSRPRRALPEDTACSLTSLCVWHRQSQRAPRKMGLNVIQDAGPEGVPHGLVTGLSGGTEQRGSGSSNHVQPSLTHRQGAVRPHGIPEQVTELLLLS